MENKQVLEVGIHSNSHRNAKLFCVWGGGDIFRHDVFIKTTTTC